MPHRVSDALICKVHTARTWFKAVRVSDTLAFKVYTALIIKYIRYIRVSDTLICKVYTAESERGTATTGCLTPWLARYIQLSVSCQIRVLDTLKFKVYTARNWLPETGIWVCDTLFCKVYTACGAWVC